jgi:hypothetical protein
MMGRCAPAHTGFVVDADSRGEKAPESGRCRENAGQPPDESGKMPT